MKKVQPNKTIETDGGSDAHDFPELRAIERRLKPLVPVTPWLIDTAFSFSVAFRSLFMAEQPNYELKSGTFGATRSNWTYHTALAIAQASRMLNLTCRFEAMGKRDAIIQTVDEPPVIMLAAEWEWDWEDVFGDGKEIDKLLATCRNHEMCEGFLLVYCRADAYVEYLEKVVRAWIGGTRDINLPPALFVHTIIFTDAGGVREFDRLRTVQVNPDGVFVWNDQLF